MKRLPLGTLWRRFKAAPRVRIMTWALVVSLLCGVTGFLEPIDDFARSLRYSLRYIPADGSIVVVGIDQKSVEQLGGKYPWPHTQDAALIENLKKAGARRIVFDRAFSDLDTAANDAVLINTLDRYRGDVYFGSGASSSNKGNVDRSLQPAEIFVPHIKIASFTQWTNPIGQLSKLYSESPTDSNRPSISTVLSGVPSSGFRLYRPDFAIRSDTFPQYSFADIALGRVGPEYLSGKDVIVGLGEMTFGDSLYLPGQARTQGMFAHAIGAQTLKSGTPVDLSWIPALLFVAAVAVALLRTARLLASGTIALATIAALLAGPLALDGRLISIDIAPALLLFGTVLVQHARLTLGWRKSRTHEASGLPNVIALRELRSRAPRALIAARIDNHAAITASFAKDVEPLIAAEIITRLKIGDAATVVYQGDEGVYYLLSPITDPALLSEHLDGLHALFSQPVRVGERQIDATITFGVDVSFDRAMSSRIGSALLSAEDARRQGGRWKIYDEARSADAVWQLSLGSEIDRGLVSGEFWVAYQPKLDLRSGAIVGAEALVRWTHPQRGPIGPVDFIPAAERDHRIIDLTRFVFRQAMADAVALKPIANVVLALNVSVPVLRQPDFADYATALVREFGLVPAMFTIEITESVFLSVEDRAVANNLEQLARAGFGISIDDFGTGFSTLESLQRVPATEVKIDQTFVKSLSNKAADRIIVSSIIKMAQGLDRKVVAEGVEDAQTLRKLAELGCDEVQGYFVGRPQPLDDFMRLIGTTSGRAAA